jgi:hypothetical protein
MCDFGASIPLTPATIIRSTLALCYTPDDTGGRPRSLPLRITRDGLPSVSNPDVLFSFYDPTSSSATTAALPPYADRRGGHNITVHGTGFQPLGSELICLIGKVSASPLPRAKDSWSAIIKMVGGSHVPRLFAPAHARKQKSWPAVLGM